MASRTAEARAAAGSGGAGPVRNPPLGPLRRGVREVGLALITLGVIVLLFVAYQLWGTGFTERHHQAVLKRGFDAAVAAAKAGHGGSTENPTVGASSAYINPGPAVGGAIDHLVIPRIHLDKYVVQGVDEADLQKGPGHYPGTVLPGQVGNSGIAGHRTTYGAPFFDLNELSPGDDIYLTNTAGRTFLYRVSARPMVVSPTDVAVLDPTPYAQLTLTTCNPRFSDTSRLVVVARLTSQPLPASTPPTTVPAAAAASAPAARVETLGAGTSVAWLPAILYGLAVVALWIGVRILINRTRRWPRVGAYVVGIAICLVPLWFCFENVVRLLPQSI
jgi:sortase A